MPSLRSCALLQPAAPSPPLFSLPLAGHVQVVTYIERIVSNGMAYASNGSVYFDTTKFRCARL